MAPVGGSLRKVTLGGRTFPATADAEAQRKLGGDENEFVANGDRATGRTIKTATPWSLDGVVLSIDDSNNDQEFLQDLIESNDLFVVAVTFASGKVYQGTGQIVGEMQVSSQNATGTVSLMGPGKLTQQ